MNKRTALISAAIVTFGLVTLYFGLTLKSPRPLKDPNTWDLLIFTQTWPNTLCYTWQGQNPNHTCNLPTQKNLWTIHGIWPTKLGKMGPNYCNTSIVFDPTLVFGIQEDLNNYWTDLEIPPKNATEEIPLNSSIILHKKESIWSHEWQKHGSCAMTLPALNTEYKYFFQGIEWSKKYNMKDILENNGIKVNSTLYVTDYWKAVKKSLKTNVWVQCVFKHDTKEQMLDEIRICFDKTLKLVDCNGIMITEKASKASQSLTNCDMNKPILYLDYVPVHNASNASNSTVDDNEWDILTFSQSWPYTFCHTWTANSNTHVCNLPANRNQWTIHGIWPSKIGTYGPSFCNNQTSFNLNALETIIPELHNRWTEIKGSKQWTRKQEGELWKHEWNKHGTCAKSLPSLNSELKYFKQGLDWSKQYSLTDLLAKGGISPGNSYPVTQFWYTLKTGLGKKPFIDCYVDKDTNKAYIDEVRLCFDKTLSLVDCDHFRRNNDKPLTNCPLNQDILYIGPSV